MKFPIKDFLSKCDQICRKLWIWSDLLKKSSMENFFFVQCYNNVHMEILEFALKELVIFNNVLFALVFNNI